MVNILLVEDETTELRMLEFILSKNGYVVTCAENGQIALSILKSKKDFDIVVSDINMDVMNGIELKENINLDNELKKIPFIFLTSVVSNEVQEKCKILGCDLYLFKPFVKFDIVKEIERVLVKF
ncbi:MAG: response regulator [Candidatus Sericytochromatia bacterium]|nr:response regulator [Candidatus Sericytochromatia bacterium]